MKTPIYAILFALIATAAVSAQSGDQKATGSVWLDVFGGTRGVVVYPQYAWSVPTSAGKFGGFGFVESAPGELFFTNHLVNFTPKAASWFTAHGEIGGIPAKGKAFVQLGPRINLHKAIPKLEKAMPRLFVAYLPELRGIRTRNLLISGATREFPIVGKRVTASVEGYDRIFDGHSYGEAWLLCHVRSWKHITPAAFVIRDTGRYVVSFGLRIAP